MISNTGELNKRIDILRYVDVENEYEQISKELKKFIKCWASINLINTKEIALGNIDFKNQNQATYKIMIRYRKNLNEDMIIQYQGQYFEITGIDDYCFSHNNLVLYCKETKQKNYKIGDSDG